MIRTLNESGVYHIPVLTREVLYYLAPKPGGIYVDATFGGGGHTRAILAHEKSARVIAFDWDAKALEINAPAMLKEFGERFTPLKGNFAQIGLLLKKQKITAVDGILADFGTSQFQLTQRAGFSFSKDAPLDMRMSTEHQKTTAAEILKRAPESELAHIFWTYDEERKSRQIARAICEVRQKKPLLSTKDLVEVVTTILPERRGGLHPATRIFQALRIVVNDELQNIESLLLHAPRLLKPKGRLVCISFHSLEDRIVKQALKEHKDVFTILTPKVVIAQPDEVKKNPSARSAHIRAAERLSDESC